jgi:hypothetical protein
MWKMWAAPLAKSQIVSPTDMISDPLQAILMRMEQAAAISNQPWASGDDRGFRRVMAAAVWRHRYVHGLALALFALAIIVGRHTGNMPDTGVVLDYGFYLIAALWAGCCGFAIVRLVWLAAVERERAPLAAMVRSFRRFFANRERIANGLNGIAAFTVFATAFSVLKGAIAILSPFSWDKDLSSLDRTLHFGRLPHEWLWCIVQTPLAVRLFNLAYNFWFVILIASMFTVAITRRDTRLRHQYMLSLMLVWAIGGFFIAMGLSSAGPCYFSRLGLGGDYQPLMDALGAADRIYPIWAFSTQEMLWNGYSGATSGSIGISAFPSLHVATAVLFALYASRRSRIAGALLWVFAAVIMIGSVVLAWHYAVDGYAGALISLAIWELTGLWLERFSPEGVAKA